MELYKKVAKIIQENPTKRILILGTICSGKKTLLTQLKKGEEYDKVFDCLFIKKFGYIDTRWISSEEKEALKKEVEIKKGIPMFSKEILPCDLLLFLHIHEPLLKLRTTTMQKSFYEAKRIQETLKRQLKNVSAPVIILEVEPREIHPEKKSRNVYICGDQNHKIHLTDKRKIQYDYQEKQELFRVRFPFIKRVSSLEELKRKTGFLLLIYEELLPKKMMEVDKNYRFLFSHFQEVYILTEDEKKVGKRYAFANFQYVDKRYWEIENMDEEVYQLFITHLLQEKRSHFQKRKQEQIAHMHHFLRRKKTWKTEEIQQSFSLSKRQVQRFMHDINLLYYDIGYDYSSNLWYLLSKR